MSAPSRASRAQLLVDACIVIVSVLVAWWMVESQSVQALLSRLAGVNHLTTFVAGLLFTSVFTAAPSVALLSELAREQSLWSLAVIGGVGAMCGDFVLYLFVRDRVSKDLAYVAKQPKARRYMRLLSTSLPRFLWPLIGALVIASPLPDEIGVMLLGLSKVRQRVFLPLVFVLNGVGILLIGYAVRSLAP